jgi:hypothetical protein
VLTGQCLDRRIGEVATLCAAIAAWETSRNVTKATVDWQFTMEKARAKLARLYPS